ncbi:hypothetical protein ACROYT_G015201 [Oculina patagonica]
MPCRRMQNKFYRYALFFFSASLKVGTAPTSCVCDGFKAKIKVGNYVRVDWEGKPVWGNILMLHDEPQVCWAALRTVNIGAIVKTIAAREESPVEEPGKQHLEQPGTSHLEQPGIPHLEQPGGQHLEQPGTPHQCQDKKLLPNTM